MFFAGKFVVILEGEMKNLWVEQKNLGLNRLEFMLFLEY